MDKTSDFQHPNILNPYLKWRTYEKWNEIKYVKAKNEWIYGGHQGYLCLLFKSYNTRMKNTYYNFMIFNDMKKEIQTDKKVDKSL